MMIFKKAIPRRTFLRGIGTTMALPLLDGMIPAFAATTDPAIRLGFFYVPNGMSMKSWTPAAEGAAFEMTPVLEPLASFRDRFLVLSGLSSNAAEPIPGDGDVAPHERAAAAYLTGIHANPGPVHVGISADQIAAKEMGKHTQLASLEIGLHSPELVGQCGKGWNCGVASTLSWRTPTTPLPMENRPRAVFEHLFGDSESTDPADRLARIQEDRSVLDVVVQRAVRFMKDLSPGDRARVTDYLDAVRDLERRIQTAEEQSSRELPTLERPAGIPPTTGEHAKLMFDLMLLAYQTDMTRVITFMLDFEISPRPYPEIGVPEGHHPVSHHAGDPKKIEKWTKVSIYHVQLFSYFLEKMRSTPDGDGSLLDHSILLYGAGISDGDTHSHKGLPALLVGGGGGKIKGGRHIQYPKDTPVTNLHLAMLDKVGIPVESIGDSTGRLEL
jgi:hypothetical protein